MRRFVAPVPLQPPPMPPRPTAAASGVQSSDPQLRPPTHPALIGPANLDPPSVPSTPPRNVEPPTAVFLTPPTPAPLSPPSELATPSPGYSTMPTATLAAPSSPFLEPEVVLERDDDELQELAPPATVLTEEDSLTEQQLREIYDEEEINRFLHLFSAHVHEVRMPHAAASSLQTGYPSKMEVVPEMMNLESQEDVSIYQGDEETEWTSLNSLDKPVAPALPPRPPKHSCLSERIALQYIVPLLPPAPPPPPPFTLGRLKLASQRVLLATEPTYRPFAVRLWSLATWENWKDSCTWCSVYWLLWSQDLLLPSLFARILWSLARRRLFPYPSLAELRERRRQIDRAEEFGNEIMARLATTSTFGVRDVWKVFRKGVKATRRPKSKDFKGAVLGEGLGSVSKDDVTVLDPPEEAEEVQDIKQAGLAALNELADFHERVRNIFLWRNPASSRIYGLIIAAIFISTLIVPARYLAKGGYAALGFMFWFVVPVIVALPPSARARLPPPLSDVPTDIDYAMELMSERVVNGLDVKPAKRMRKRPGKSTSQISLLSSAGDSTLSLLSDGEEVETGSSKSKDWVRAAVNAANTSKSWVDDGRRLVKGMQGIPSGDWPSSGSSAPSIMSIGSDVPEVDSHPFLAQHSKGPGLITITSSMFFFTPVVSHGTSVKLAIPLEDIRGVKKAGAMKGLYVRWVQDGGEKFEKFFWVRGRDEAFARLVAVQKRWLRI